MKRHRFLSRLGISSVLVLVLFTVLIGCAPCGMFPIFGAEPEIQFWADQEVVPRGGCTALHWEVQGAGDYPVILNGEEVPPFGEREVCLEEPQMFELIVEAPGGPYVESVTIHVEGEAPPEEHPPEEPLPEGGPEIIVLVTDPDAIHQGECAMLHWEVHPPEFPVFLDGQGVPPMGEQQVCPQQTTTYELLVEVAGGVEARTVTLQVEPAPGPASPGPPTGTPMPGVTPPPTTAPPGPTTAPAPTTAPPPTPPPPPSGADVRPSDLYPDNQPQGNIWVRVVNDGPTTLSNKKVRIGGSYTRSTLTSPPTASGANIAPADYTINLAPGQQQNINLGWQIDLTQYNYDFTVTVTAVDFTDPNTGNNSYKESFAGTPAPFVPRWGQCSWVGVESAGINSHQPVTWCSNGSFVTGLDLDRQAIDPLDSPVVGQAHCCPLAVGQFSNWGACSWVGVETAGINSHQAVAWCPDGSYITGLDLDRQAIDPLDSPVVGQVQCCPMVAAQYSKWNSCSWVGVEKAGINSHQPVTWCPNGSFLAGFDLDRQAIDPLDSPVVGQALCCRP